MIGSSLYFSAEGTDTERAYNPSVFEVTRESQQPVLEQVGKSKPSEDLQARNSRGKSALAAIELY